MLDLFPVPVRLALCDLEAPGWGSHRPCWFCFCFCLCFLLFGFLPVLFGFGFFVFAFCVLHGDSSMDYVSIQFSSLLSHIVKMTNVSTASVNLHNAIVLPA